MAEKNAKKELNKDMVELGSNIQRQREFLGLSQESIALDLGTNAATISAYESGQRSVKAERLFQIADLLMVTPNDLAPERFNNDERLDPRLFQIGEKMKKLTPEKQAAAYQAMEALVAGFMTME